MLHAPASRCAEKTTGSLLTPGISSALQAPALRHDENSKTFLNFAQISRTLHLPTSRSAESTERAATYTRKFKDAPRERAATHRKQRVSGDPLVVFDASERWRGASRKFSSEFSTLTESLQPRQAKSFTAAPRKKMRFRALGHVFFLCRGCGESFQPRLGKNTLLGPRT